MTIRQEYICDKKGCPSREVASPGLGSPTGWVMYRAPTMVQPAMLSWTDTRWFCSVACLRDSLMDLPPAPDPNKGVVFTCDNCEKEISLRPGDEWPVWVEMKREEQGATRFGFCSNSCLVLWMGIYADNHFTDTLSKKFLAEHAVKP